MSEIVPQSVETADILKIMDLLPHRYPFLLIDRIIEIRGDESGIGIKNVTFERTAIRRPFPGTPGLSRRLHRRGHGAVPPEPLRASALSARTPNRSSVFFMTIDKVQIPQAGHSGDTRRL